ncbi:unnamed protein product [Didymodactylos carnosus]|uniref:Uncharacterized protein n=1 Tax=Didymodactylos carnosus TaxID=1234261 RepID=A0A815GGA1_9BILA|nr:unnamed protein product [Didymodactylos carnosus]CAF4199289.1 unnamed protein product [Didymodactylos carnosus]
MGTAIHCWCLDNWKRLVIPCGRSLLANEGFVLGNNAFPIRTTLLNSSGGRARVTADQYFQLPNQIPLVTSGYEELGNMFG